MSELALVGIDLRQVAGRAKRIGANISDVWRVV